MVRNLIHLVAAGAWLAFSGLAGAQQSRVIDESTIPGSVDEGPEETAEADLNWKSSAAAWSVSDIKWQIDRSKKTHNRVRTQLYFLRAFVDCPPGVSLGSNCNGSNNMRWLLAELRRLGDDGTQNLEQLVEELVQEGGQALEDYQAWRGSPDEADFRAELAAFFGEMNDGFAVELQRYGLSGPVNCTSTSCTPFVDSIPSVVLYVLDLALGEIQGWQTIPEELRQLADDLLPRGEGILNDARTGVWCGVQPRRGRIARERIPIGEIPFNVRRRKLARLTGQLGFLESIVKGIKVNLGGSFVGHVTVEGVAELSYHLPFAVYKAAFQFIGNEIDVRRANLKECVDICVNDKNRFYDPTRLWCPGN